MMDPSPCSYKSACKTCRYTLETERPGACIELSCEYLTQCKKCGANTTLDKSGRCRTCARGKADNNDTVIVRTENGFNTVNASEVPMKGGKTPRLHQKPVDVQLNSVVESVVKEIRDGVSEEETVSIDAGFSAPGVPPSGLTDDEAAYYKKQWNRYVEYYPDPTLESTLHTIVVIELELLWITSRAANARGEYDMELMSRRSRLTADIKGLRSSLPEEEASEMSDREASLAYAYEQYVAERGKNSFGGADRVFSKDAVALNASLPFKTDLSYILKKLGYAEGDTRKILDEAREISSKTPMEVAELFGFSVLKEFAMDDNFSGAAFEEDDDPT